MIATFINSFTVIVGSLIGLIIHKNIKEEFKEVVFTSIGLITFVIGFRMALETREIIILAIGLVGGGMIGYAIRIEDGIYRFGELLDRSFPGKKERGEKNFPLGFLNASVLFCVGAMAVVGSFKAGVEGDYDLILTKSVMDGFLAILLTATYGIGVAFSALTIMVYQGGLTLLSRLIKPYVNDALLTELSAVGGVMIIMIGLNLLKIREVKTANFLPALVVIPLLLYLGGTFSFPF